MLDLLSVADVCEGNPDERFLTLPSIQNNCIKDATGMLCVSTYISYKLNLLLGNYTIATLESGRGEIPSLYHSHCEVLIAQGRHRCECCKKHRKSLYAIASRYCTTEIAGTIGQTTCRSTSESTELEEELEPTSLMISLPISSYGDSPSRSIDELLGRLKKQGSIPSGMERNVVNTDIIDL